MVGKEGALGGGGGGLQQRHRWLYRDDEVISSAWKCLVLWQISMSGGAVEQEGAGNLCVEAINRLKG